MKITKQRLKEIIREEIQKLNEAKRIGVTFTVQGFIDGMRVFQQENSGLFNKLLKTLGVDKSKWERVK